MYTGILYLLIPQLPVISKALGYILEKSIVFMNKALAIIEHAPFASINKIWLNKSEYLLAYIIICCLFYFLFERRSWLLKLGLTATLLLCLSISFKKVNTFQSDQLTFLNLKKHPGLVFKNGDQAIVLTDIKADDKTYQYAVQPYLDSNKIANTALYNLKDNITTSFLVKKSNLIQFKNKLILIFDDQLQNKLLSQKLKVDYVYITGNPHTTINNINNSFDFQTIIIDGSNTDYLVNNLKRQAENLHINCELLKRNKSYTILSN
jgi:competence protein ComEC